ncbi:unnamed protein product [Arabidopsis thaliana]|uniref:(thale cress) hypothetical protein n=2 Tax=Arabidopsis thaliana TaxID=3702 RepID=A0A7G2FAV0_ARATH|nr:unnamed protein product [Arabidopsis thaliana]
MSWLYGKEERETNNSAEQIVNAKLLDREKRSHTSTTSFAMNTPINPHPYYGPASIDSTLSKDTLSDVTVANSAESSFRSNSNCC